MRELRIDATNERGTVLLIVGVAMTILFGISALVIDMGQNLSEQRRLSTATDAAALAAAQAYGYGAAGCANIAPDYLSRNADDATLLGCDAFGDTTNGTFGWVVVEAEITVGQFFAGTIGRDTVTISHSSVAVFGGLDGSFSSGARPMSLCFQGLLSNPAYLAWQALPAGSGSAPIKILYNKNQPDDCGDTTGNWGFIDFDGGSNSNSDTKDWIEFGFPDPVEVGWYEGSPGAMSGTHKSALQALKNSGEQFWLPVVTEGGGNGANVMYHVTNFMPVRLVDFKVTGKQSKRFVEIVIDPTDLSGSCCAPPTGVDNGIRATGLFALDENGMPIGVNP